MNGIMQQGVLIERGEVNSAKTWISDQLRSELMLSIHDIQAFMAWSLPVINLAVRELETEGAITVSDDRRQIFYASSNDASIKLNGALLDMLDLLDKFDAKMPLFDEIVDAAKAHTAALRELLHDQYE